MAELAPQISSNVDVLTREFEAITHNLANANTPGFKRHSIAFRQALEAQQSVLDEPSGLIVEQRQIDFSQGSLKQTGRSLDLALSGPGFFVVESPQGPLYTRNGIFHVDTNGQLVDSEGRSVAGEGGPITLPPNVDIEALSIGADGTVKAGTQTLGQLRVVSFENNLQQLVTAGSGTFNAPAGLTPQTTEQLIIQQGYQEGSNVSSVKEMVNMLTVSRLYEANISFLTARREASDSLMSVAMG
ncbi:flagellar basal-body rod protein FlgF [Planctomycetota bacterium]